MAQARQAIRHSDTEVMVGKAADTVDEPPVVSETVAEKPDVSAGESITRLKLEFLNTSKTQTSVASTMTPVRYIDRCYIHTYIHTYIQLEFDSAALTK